MLFRVTAHGKVAEKPMTNAKMIEVINQQILEDIRH
jgi:hypothetical protein